MQKENYERHYMAGLIITLLIIVGLTAAAFNESARMEDLKHEMFNESSSRGGDIYREQCTSCHGARGEGGAGPALRSKTYLESATDQVIFETIRAGRPGTIMPAWAQDNGGPLTDEDIRDIANFMRGWEEAAPEVAGSEFVPDASRGMTLFNGSCFICHGENGVGGEIAPAINDVSRLVGLDNQWYRDVISNGRPAKGMPTWGTVLSPNQIEDLIALIDAWRAGERVASETKVSAMLNAALFAVSQDDAEDTFFYLDRAEPIAFGPIKDNFDDVRSLVADENFDAAFDLLAELSEDWPIGEAHAGAEVYAASCASCHGVDGEGVVGPSMQPNEFIQESSNAELLAFILSGRDGTAMSGFGDRLSEKQIADVIAFLRDWQPPE